VRRYAVVRISCALFAVACGGAPSQPAPLATASAAPTAAGMIIQMGDHFFDPAQLTVKVGTTVTWKNGGQSTHYPYVCAQHEGDGMAAELTVID